MIQLDSYIITLTLGGLTIHDQSKTNNHIQKQHKHTNKVGTMITIHPHDVVHTSLLKVVKVLSNL